MSILSAIRSKFSNRKNDLGDTFESRSALSLMSSALGSNGLSATPLQVSASSMLAVSAIFSAIRIRGETLSNLPFRAMERKGRERILSEDTSLQTLLMESPDGNIPAVEFFHTMESHSCLYGSAYAYIERDVNARPIRLIQIPAFEVVRFSPDYSEPQKMYYNVRGLRTPASDLIVIPFGQVYPYWICQSPQRILNTPFALAQALDREAYNLLANGCSTSGVLQTDQILNEQAQRDLKNMLESYRAGGKQNGAYMVLQNGLKYVSARMSNKDAEFIEQKKQSILDISAVYGVPSYQLGDGTKVNYASQEEANRNFLYSTMLHRVRLFENELTNKLIPLGERLKGKAVVADYKGFMRGSMTARAEFYSKLYMVGALSANDICAFEDLPMNPNPNADLHFVPVNMTALENLESNRNEE